MPMNIAITGSSGLLGTGVSERLRADGHRLTRVVRSRETARQPDALYWDPARGAMDADALAGHDAVINLAGENLFTVWTEAKKRRIRQSRVGATALLVETLRRLPHADRPGLLINTSAIGYYGSPHPDREMDEDATPAPGGFMTDVVRDWEAAAWPARDLGVRVVALRFAPVLHPSSLPLEPLALATRFGLGATLGAGRQPFPWVTRADVASVVTFVLDRPDLHGPINVVAPHMVSNAEFTDTVARVLGRPRWLRIPAPLIRLGGELGREMLGGARVVPRRLLEAGYDWQDPALEPALRRLLRSAR
jgi:uncharacterized protein